MKIHARLIILCTLVLLAGCGQHDCSSDSRASTPATNASDASLSRTRERNGTARGGVQLGDDITRHVTDYMMLLRGTNAISDVLSMTNQPIALQDEQVRRLRMSAYAADRARDATQCLVLATLLVRCTNLPNYVGSSVDVLMAQAVKDVCGMEAAVPYYERVLVYWRGLSHRNEGDDSDALTAANNLAQAAFAHGETDTGLQHSGLMYEIAATCKLPGRVKDTYKMNHIYNTFRKQGRAAAMVLLEKTTFDNAASRECAQRILAEP